MSTKLFNKDKTIQAILYILKQLGGKCDIHKCHKILYFADNAHLCKWGRSITGDVYICMEYGAVPTCVYDLFKAVRGDSYFRENAENVRNNYFHFVNNYDVVSTAEPDMDWLSVSDVSALDYAISEVRNKSFAEVSEMSHGSAWKKTKPNTEISVRDRLSENGETEDFISYVEEKLAMEEALA